jgi:uncharacterized protein (TIGR02270 family)
MVKHSVAKNQPNGRTSWQIAPGTIRGVVAMHAEEAAFLWMLRDAAVRAPHYKLKDLLRLEERLQAHLDGLRTAGQAGWEVVAAALEEGKSGTVFTAGILALGSGNEEWIPLELEAGVTTRQASRGLMSALAWVPIDKASVPIKTLLASDQPEKRRIGLAGAAAHRKMPSGDSFPEALGSDDPLLRARALRIVGELGLVNSHLACRANLRAKAPNVRFWAAWSNALLDGSKDAVACLQNIAETGGPLAERAARMAMRRLAPNDAKAWIKKLVKELGMNRLAIIAAGAFADPEVIPFLIDQMRTPKLAKVAGESFSLITGANLAHEDLDGEPPEAEEPASDDITEEQQAAARADLSLPYPDPALVQKWWNARQGKFARGTRYLLGQPIATESLRSALKNGYQRQRAAAALELAILRPGRPLFEVRAPGWRQQAWLNG